MKRTNLFILKVNLIIIVIFGLNIFNMSHLSAKPSGGSIIEGVIVAESTLSPVAGVNVKVKDSVTKTDEHGKYIISGLLPGRLAIEAKHPDYADFIETIKVCKGTNSFNIKIKSGGVKITEDKPRVSGEISKYSIEDLRMKSRERVENYKKGPVAEKITASEAFKNTNYIAGKVIDMVSAVPISRAKVEVGGEVYFSDVNGEFISKPISKSQVIIRAESALHNAYESDIKITSGKNKIKILLMPRPEESIASTSIDRGKLVELGQFAQRYSSVSGRVRNAKTKEPISDATVIVATMSAKTNIEGYYMIEGLPLGLVDLTVIAGNFGVHKGKINLSKVTNINDVALNADERFGGVNGMIVEKETGKPIYGAKVQLGNRIVVSDQFGNFNIKDVVYDYYNLIVEQKGYQRIEKAISINQENITVNVELADEYQSVK